MPFFLAFSGDFWWIPIVGPHIGAVVGALLYILLVGAHFYAKEQYDLEEQKNFARCKVILLLTI